MQEQRLLNVFFNCIYIAQLANIVDIAVSDGRFKTLVTALTAANLVTTLEGPGPFTVFAPTDDAFAKLPPGTVDSLLRPERRQELIKILTYHVISGKAITAADIVDMRPPFKLTMLDGIPTNITKVGASIQINNATVTQADIMASNGIIHVIDTVLIPQDLVATAVSDGRFKTLVTALIAADLVPALKGNGIFTVFAPTDVAFAKLPPGTLDDLLKPANKAELINVLTYHVVGGKALTAADLLAMDLPAQLAMLDNSETTISQDGFNLKINDASVIQADILALNGIIHAIDTVLSPPGILDAIISTGRFQTLVTCLIAADLVSTLKGFGPFTVFAPTDAAFAKLPPGTIEDLLKPENKPKLINILTYHVVSGRALKAQDLNAMGPPFQLEMLNGGATTIKIVGLYLQINNANIIQFDITGVNGVAHGIDTVLLPSE